MTSDAARVDRLEIRSAGAAVAELHAGRVLCHRLARRRDGRLYPRQPDRQFAGAERRARRLFPVWPASSTTSGPCGLSSGRGPATRSAARSSDVRTKADRSDVEAYYLARFLAAMKPEVQTGLIGYSYGARIIGGALHLLGGGTAARLDGSAWRAAADARRLVGRGRARRLARCRAAITARPCRMAEPWFITHNCCDPVLARYRWVEKCGDPVALGYSGLFGRNLLPPS